MFFFFDFVLLSFLLRSCDVLFLRECVRLLEDLSWKNLSVAGFGVHWEESADVGAKLKLGSNVRLCGYRENNADAQQCAVFRRMTPIGTQRCLTVK